MTKGQFMNAYASFTETVSENHESYSEEKWEDKDQEMDHFIEGCYQKYDEKFTDDEKKDFWIKYFKYKYDRHGRSVLRAIEADMRDFDLAIDEHIEDLFDNPEEDLKDIFREVYGDDLEKVIDEFQQGLDEFSKKLKEWLREE